MRFWQKPVSSLRSLFENKSNASSGSTPRSTLSPSRPSARPEDAQDDSQASIRISLDIPRNPSPWSTTRTALLSQGPATADPPVPRSRQPSSRILQRPVSTTSLSTPRSPPLVTVNSPTSPPKGPQLAGIQPSFRSGTAKPLKDFSIAPQSPPMAPGPPQRARPRTMVSSPRLSRTESENSIVDSQPFIESITNGLGGSTAKSPPPPVNRADKPKVPTKSGSGPGKVSLEPLVPAADEKVSPFSTPPSSDESLEPVSDRLDRGRASQSDARGMPRRRIAPQPTLQFLHGMQHPSDQIESQKLQGLDARRLGFTRGTVSQYPMADNPPGLPPRRVQKQQSFHASEVEHADSSSPLLPKPVPRNGLAQLQRTLTSPPAFLPPPKRALTSTTPHITQDERLHPPRKVDYTKGANSYLAVDPPERQESEMGSNVSAASDYPEIRNSSMNPGFLIAVVSMYAQQAILREFGI